MSAGERLGLLRAKMANRKLPETRREGEPKLGELPKVPSKPDPEKGALKAKLAEIGRLLGEAKQRANVAKQEADTLKGRVAVLERDLWESKEYVRYLEESYRTSLWVNVGLVVCVGVLVFSLLFPWWTWL